MPTIIDSSPFPLGFVHPVPGTPQSILVNYPDLEVDLYSCNLILVQADSQNLGRSFLGNRRLNVLTREGLIWTFNGPADSFVLANTAQNVYRLSDFMVDVEFLGDGVQISIYIR